jgi:type IX secretion system PorP/SprF family membrane protein
MRPNLTLLAILLLLAASTDLSGQDPFFVHFFNNKSYFNPALTGFRGAMTLDAKYKSQWGSSTVVSYDTYGVSYEESVPCGWMDYGLHFYSDQEGDGILTTHEFGGSLAGTIPIAYGRNTGSHNIRAGMSFFLGQKRVDFSRLVFSDQLNRKYGIYDNTGALNPTAFVVPNGGESQYYLMPKVGAVYRYAAGARRNNPPRVFVSSFMAGASVHNLLDVFQGANVGHTSSLLNLDTELSLRQTYFIETEIAMPFGSANNYFSLTPLLLYQTQNRLDYLEAGAKITFSRRISAGAYYHLSTPSAEGTNTSWFNLILELGTVIGKKDKHRVDFGFAYANNFTGLQNVVGPLLEFSFSYHIRRSNFCEIMGRQNELGGGVLCPVSPSGKIYEPIW